MRQKHKMSVFNDFLCILQLETCHLFIIFLSLTKNFSLYHKLETWLFRTNSVARYMAGMLTFDGIGPMAPPPHAGLFVVKLLSSLSQGQGSCTYQISTNDSKRL